LKSEDDDSIGFPKRKVSWIEEKSGPVGLIKKRVS